MQPKQEPIVLEFAGFWRRLGAFIIDILIIVAVTTLFIPFWGFDFFGFEGLNDVIDQWGWASFSWSLGHLIQFLLTAAYFIAFWVWRGQTPGKMALRIKILRTDGANITLTNALLRYLGYLLAPLTLFIVFIWIAFDRHKQGIHDKIADTVVVKLPEPTITMPEASASA